MRPALLAFLLISMSTLSPAAPPQLSTLRVGDETHGFRVASIYLDATDRPMGARFMHRRTGFTLDLMQLETVPQAFTWVNSFATSDQGEPHTQEHLLLLRGVRGRTLQARDSMSLVTSSAFTMTWRTCYFFNTTAGVDVFFDVFAEQQRAMLHPDYTDGEIRLEVRNFGVTKAADGKLRLEEKGTVYNEMVSSMANAAWKEWRAVNHVAYGERHPLGYNQGGEPAGIRTMTPEDIRRFHAATHHLGNMGTIAAFPKKVALADALARFDAILSKDAKGPPRPADTLDTLPPPAGDPEGAIRMYDYPHQNAQQPSPFTLVWPAARKLDASEQLLAELFFANLAGDATTNLYKIFVDSRTKKSDLGVRSVSSEVQAYGGNPIHIAFTDANPEKMGDDGLKAARALVVAEIARIAALPDDSAELREFNERIAGRVVERERGLAKFVGTPPGFGARGGNAAWMEHLLLLEKTADSKKSLTLKPQFAFVRERLASGRNFWREYLAKWKVTGVTPYVAGARPSTRLIAQEEKERDARLAEETARIQARFGGVDEQEALKRHGASQEAEFAQIEAASKVAPMPFLKSPPMTLDDDIRFEQVKLANGVPLVASRFDDMTGVMTGLALRLDGVPREELRYVSLLPGLLSTVGVIENGKPVPYEQMRERLRREVLQLQATFSTNVRTGRVELSVTGSGIGLDESRRALDWMALILFSPDWRPENLPRIRDVVDQALAGLRNTPQAPEEYWVNDPANAYRMQRHPAWLATASFLTRTHNALRLRWLLKDAGADAEPVAKFLADLAASSAKLPRAELAALLSGDKAPGLGPLTPAQAAIAKEALRDLQLSLGDMPDATLATDFTYLAGAIAEGLRTPATDALARLESLRKRIARAGGARMWVAGPQSMRATLAPDIAKLAARLSDAPAAPIWHGGDGLIDARLREREPDAIPQQVGLFAPNKQGGVLMTSVPSAHYADFGSRDAQLDFLAARVNGGGAPHSAFAKTVGAGLAYSNGVRGTIASGRVGYYAERTPELPQTVRFVVDLLKDTKPDPWYAEYVMALAVGVTRAAGTYEARAEGIATELADGQAPDQVRRFRQSLLELRKDPKLLEKVFERRDRVNASIVPGYQPKASAIPGTISFAIGPDRQLDAWDAYLKANAGTRLYKLYPRDFWM
jgi:Zn-dependent M16 (insulinase) family peptidase